MKILIVKLQAFGDILMTTPAVRLLKENHPDWELHHLVLNQYANTTRGNPRISKQFLIRMPKKNLVGLIKSIPDFIRLYVSLKREKYDSIIMFHSAKKILFCCRLLGVPDLVSAPAGILDLKINFALIFKEMLAEHYSDMSKGANDNRLEFFVDAQSVSPDFQKYKDKKIICVHPGGGVNFRCETAIKRWPAQHVTALIKKMQEDYPEFTIVITGGNADLDIIEEVTSGVTDLVNLGGKTTMNDLGWLFSQAHLVVTPDNGALHLAAACCQNVVTIFGPTDPVQLLPLSTNIHLVKTSVLCAPCYFGIFKGCRTGLENCMKDVPVSEVFAVVQKCMAGGVVK